jgi:hypothetical protein
MLVPNGVDSAKVERAYVQGLIDIVVLSMEGNSHKALLKYVTNADIYLDGSFGKITAFQPDDTGFGFFVNMHGIRVSRNSGKTAIGWPQRSRSEPLSKVD